MTEESIIEKVCRTLYLRKRAQ